MIRRKLLISGLIVGGAISSASSAFAGVVRVPFAGTVASACGTATNVTPGVLGFNPATPRVLDSRLTGFSGAAGSFTVNCTNPANLRVDSFNITAGPAPVNPTSSTVVVKATGANTGTANLTGNIPLPRTGNTNFRVDAAVTNSVNLAAGRYQGEVIMTITP